MVLCIRAVKARVGNRVEMDKMKVLCGTDGKGLNRIK
jgi:hypothetical protein